MRTIADSIKEGLAIRGVEVRFVMHFNVFTGKVSHQHADGQIVAEGKDLFGKRTVKGPAWNFEVTQ